MGGRSTAGQSQYSVGVLALAKLAHGGIMFSPTPDEVDTV